MWRCCLAGVAGVARRTPRKIALCLAKINQPVMLRCAIVGSWAAWGHDVTGELTSAAGLAAAAMTVRPCHALTRTFQAEIAKQRTQPGESQEGRAIRSGLFDRSP